MRRSLFPAFIVFALLCQMKFAIADEFYPIPCPDELVEILDDDIDEVQNGLSNIIELIDAQDFQTENKSIQWFGIPNREALEGIRERLENALTFAGVVEFLCVPQMTYYKVPGGYAETFAYVYANRPIVYILGNYFELADEGEDSRRGTLVHELSHLSFVATANGLPDSKEIYDKEEALQLAKDDSESALNNAQNYQFFYEDVLFDIMDD